MALVNTAQQITQGAAAKRRLVLCGRKAAVFMIAALAVLLVPTHAQAQQSGIKGMINRSTTAALTARSTADGVPLVTSLWFFNNSTQQQWLFSEVLQDLKQVPTDNEVEIRSLYSL